MSKGKKALTRKKLSSQLKRTALGVLSGVDAALLERKERGLPEAHTTFLAGELDAAVRALALADRLDGN